MESFSPRNFCARDRRSEKVFEIATHNSAPVSETFETVQTEVFQRPGRLSPGKFFLQKFSPKATDLESTRIFLRQMRTARSVCILLGESASPSEPNSLISGGFGGFGFS